MLVIGGTAGDPAGEQILLGRRQGLVRLWRRHHDVGISGVDPRDQFALIRLVGGDCPRATLQQCGCSCSRIESQASLLFSGTVTGVAVLAQDRPDGSAEVNRCLICMEGRGRRDQQAQAEDSEPPPRESFHYKRTMRSHEYNLCVERYERAKL